MENAKIYSLEQAKRLLEQYCVYQDRCHKEVNQKLREINMIPQAIDLIIVHLIEHGFLDETRFAKSFFRGKHRMKHWGKIRIVNELKFRNITNYNINLAIKEITETEYFATFDMLAQRHWGQILEKNMLKKRKKFCDYMLRKGFESQLVYDKLKFLEKESL